MKLCANSLTNKNENVIGKVSYFLNSSPIALANKNTAIKNTVRSCLYPRYTTGKITKNKENILRTLYGNRYSARQMFAKGQASSKQKILINT